MGILKTKLNTSSLLSMHSPVPSCHLRANCILHSLRDIMYIDGVGLESIAIILVLNTGVVQRSCTGLSFKHIHRFAQKIPPSVHSITT